MWIIWKNNYLPLNRIWIVGWKNHKMWQTHEVAWVTRWKAVHQPWRQSERENKNECISWQYQAFDFQHNYACHKNRAIFRIFFFHHYYFFVFIVLNMRPTKHCRLIFRNSLVANYSVADLIKHINNDFFPLANDNDNREKENSKL